MDDNMSKKSRREDWKRLCVICHQKYGGRKRGKDGKFLASNS